MKTVLTVDRLCKTFQQKQVVNNISFQVREGEIMALLGPNGAGKSTTIRSIMDILAPNGGGITFHHEKNEKICRSNIGYLPEERGLYKNVQVMDMLLYLADLKDYPLDRAKERAFYYLEKFGLTGKEKTNIEALSKGMAQKVQFIGTILHEPALLILDEPFSGLDPVSQELLKEEVRNLASKGTAIILSSHQMNLVEEMSDRVFLMHQGKEVLYGSLDEIKSSYANVKCMIRGKNSKNLYEGLPGVQSVEHNGDTTTLVLKKDIHPTNWLRQLPEGLHILELHLQRASLHEIFIDIASEKYAEKVGKAHV